LLWANSNDAGEALYEPWVKPVCGDEEKCEFSPENSCDEENGIEDEENFEDDTG
jgi:hypothetical protein